MPAFCMWEISESEKEYVLRKAHVCNNDAVHEK